jgi:hypothetical protein
MTSVALGGFSMKNLSLCCDESFGIPFDLSLKIVDGDKDEVLRFHKFVFALHSDVVAEKIRNSVNSSLSFGLHGDIEALKLVKQFCYNFPDPFHNISIQLLELVLKHRHFNTPSSGSRYGSKAQIRVFEEVVDLALENKTLPRLVDALYGQAKNLIPRSDLTELFLQKYSQNSNYNMIVSKIDANFLPCFNCKVPDVRCLNRKEVTLRNFVEGAMVMVADRRSGKGCNGIHKLDTIIDRETGRFSGFFRGDLPTPELFLKPGVYLFNCSNM